MTCALATRTYFEDKQRVRSILTKAGGTTVQRLSYDYDDRLNLTRRTDALQGMSEHFEHDKLDRLKCADFDPAPGCAEGYSYGPDGNILHKPGFGPIAYDLQHPHAAVSGPGGPFQYDDVGNQIARASASIEYTPFDLPKRFTLAHGGTVELDYDGNQARIRKTTAEKETIYLGDLYERVTDNTTGAVVHEFHVRSGERVVAVIKQQAWGPSSSLYVHVDHLGSVDVITDEAGAVREQRSYDAFGARRNPIWGAPPLQGPYSSEATLGFTGHEEDDELGLVNMKGRLYDPQVGRFLTPDPLIGTPTFGQSWNPYSYVANSPLSYVDPSGFNADENKPPDTSPPPEPSPASDPVLTVWVIGDPPPWRTEPKQAQEEPREPAEVGATSPPTDMNVWGKIAPFMPPAPSIDLDEETRRAFDVTGELLIGAAEGTGEIALNIARDTVLNTWTFGGYGAYKLGSALCAGYEEDGVVGAINSVNPFLPFLIAGIDTTLAATSARRLTPAQRAALVPGEVEGVGVGHAEVTGVQAAQGMGLTPTAVGASRPICPACAKFLESHGIKAVSPLK